ncbi:MAG: regulatory protein RecX [Gammaproteobacteria bacterium]
MSSPSLNDARVVAMRLLAIREHSTVELARKLGQKGIGEEEIAQLLPALTQENLLSDARFTESFVHARQQRGSGPVKIRNELQQHQISPELIASYLEPQDPVWTEAAARVREKKFGRALPEEFKEQVRQSRFLEYRGFSHEQIRAVLRDEEWAAS